MLRGFLAGQIFFIGVPFITKTNIAPVSTTTCKGEIVGVHGCMLHVHTSPLVDTFDLTNVLSSLSPTAFLVGYKVLSETKL